MLYGFFYIYNCQRRDSIAFIQTNINYFQIITTLIYEKITKNTFEYFYNF